MPTGRLLIRNGCVIDTEPEPTVRRGTDLLIDGDRIAAIGTGLPADGARIIDATNRIVLPGFVDTHRHVWQAALRGAAVDVDLAGYFELIQHRYAPRFRPADVRIGNLLGALDCLAAGITTVQDFSHIQLTPEHAEAAVAGLREAGIRAVFGYGLPVTNSDPLPAEPVRALRDRHFGVADQLLTMALAPGGPAYRPMDVVRADWQLAEELDLPIVTHIGSSPVAAEPVGELRRAGLLRPNTLYVHGNSLADSDLRLIADSGGAVAITPAVEARMGHGAPMIGRLRRHGIRTGLGVDVVTSVAGDLFAVLRAAWLTSHLTDSPRVTPADLLRMATMDGAAALGLADRIGSLRPGKQADVVLVDTDAVNLATAERHDPIGAVVAAAHPGNVATVLVAGRVVKRDGVLDYAGLPALLAAARESAEYVAG